MHGGYTLVEGETTFEKFKLQGDKGKTDNNNHPMVKAFRYGGFSQPNRWFTYKEPPNLLADEGTLDPPQTGRRRKDLPENSAHFQ